MSVCVCVCVYLNCASNTRNIQVSADTQFNDSDRGYKKPNQDIPI